MTTLLTYVSDIWSEHFQVCRGVQLRPNVDIRRLYYSTYSLHNHCRKSFWAHINFRIKRNFSKNKTIAKKVDSWLKNYRSFKLRWVIVNQLFLQIYVLYLFLWQTERIVDESSLEKLYKNKVNSSNIFPVMPETKHQTWAWHALWPRYGDYECSFQFFIEIRTEY